MQITDFVSPNFINWAKLQIKEHPQGQWNSTFSRPIITFKAKLGLFSEKFSFLHVLINSWAYLKITKSQCCNTFPSVKGQITTNISISSHTPEILKKKKNQHPKCYLKWSSRKAGQVKSIVQLFISHRTAQSFHLIRAHNWCFPLKHKTAVKFSYHLRLPLLPKSTARDKIRLNVGKFSLFLHYSYPSRNPSFITEVRYSWL